MFSNAKMGWKHEPIEKEEISSEDGIEISCPEKEKYHAQNGQEILQTTAINFKSNRRNDITLEVYRR
jgi:hypothetical protein